MTAHAELLPCPFCGTVPDLSNPYTIQMDQGDKWGYVQCCCRGPEVRTGYEPVEKWRGDAIEAWNTRALLAKPEAGDREERIEAWREGAMLYLRGRLGPSEPPAGALRMIDDAVTLMREGGAPADGELVAAAEALHYTAQCAVEAIRCVDGDDEQRTERRWRAAYSLEQKAIALGKALAAVRARGGKNDDE